MALALEGRAMKDDILIGDTPKARKRRKRVKALKADGRLWKHSTLADICGVVTPDEIAKAFTFTLVRNPWDRMVSYYHWLRVQDFEHPAVKLAQHSTFDVFLTSPMTENAVKRASYAHYMTDAAGTERCRAFIRIEHFEEDVQPLWAHLGFALELPKANASSRERDYRSYYTDSLAAYVETLCAQDISRFAYKF